MKHSFRNCPVCGKSHVEVMHTQLFELPEQHPLTKGYDVVKCLSCGFVYADTNVSQAEYNLYYTELSKYEDKKIGTGGTDNPYDLARMMDTAHQIEDFLNNPSSRILDVGCANGGLLNALKIDGYRNLCGIDPSPVCVKNTSSLGLEAHLGSLFQDFPYGKFDLVVLSHILEHVQDLHGAIAWIIEALHSDGKQIVYIEVPDAMRYVDFLYAPFQDFNTEHINHFSSTSLKNIMCQFGFEELEAGEKIIPISQNMFYPAIFGYWRKVTNHAIDEISPDTLLGAKINEYIYRSKAILDSIEENLHNVLYRTDRVIVWGTGQLAMKLLAETSLGKANIIAFVDNNLINQGKTLHGVKILPPQSLKGLEVPILITTILHQQEIVDQISELGLPNEILLLLT